MRCLTQPAYAAAIGSLLGVALTSAGSLTIHVRQSNVRIKEGLVFGTLSVLGSFLGARASLLIDDLLIVRVFAIFLVLVAVLFAYNTVRGSTKVAPPRDGPMTWREKLGLIAVATVTGFATGLFGVGGGFMVVPALVLIMKMTMRHAVGTSLLVMVISSLVGILGRLPFQGDLDFQLIGLFRRGLDCRRTDRFRLLVKDSPTCPHGNIRCSCRRRRHLHDGPELVLGGPLALK